MAVMQTSQLTRSRCVTHDLRPTHTISQSTPIFTRPAVQSSAVKNDVMSLDMLRVRVCTYADHMTITELESKHSVREPRSQ